MALRTAPAAGRLALLAAGWAEMGLCRGPPQALRIQPSPAGRVSQHLVGYGIEDVNHELYGGLYSQMVYGEDFEEPAGPTGVSGNVTDPSDWFSPTWAPLPPSSGGAPPAFEVITSNVLNGRQAQLLMPGPPGLYQGEPARILNRGLYQQGLHVAAGREYEGYVYARLVQRGAPGGQPPALEVSLVRTRSGVPVAKLASVAFPLAEGSQWVRLNFTLRPAGGADCRVERRSAGCFRAGPRRSASTPEGECVVCDGGLVLAASGGPVAVDFVFLQPAAWGRFHGLPVRRDVAALLQAVGVGALRLGGSTCNVDGWRWKNMRGPREGRQPYAGNWHPFASQGWRIFEFLELCERLGVQAVVTLNNQEAPEDLADLVEYAHGNASTAWGRQRITDGRQEPYPPFVIEIGNEQMLDYQLIRQVADGAEAMRVRAQVVGVDPSSLRFAIGHNLDMATINTPVCDAMVNATRFLGESVMWDLHVDGDKPEQEDQWDATFEMALQMLDRLGSSMRLAVFEENAALHDVGRGLNRARYAATYARLRGRFALATAANGLQVFGLNDNGWDQGAVFMAPDRAWLSPFGHADRMVAAASQPFLLDAQLEPSSAALPRSLDVVATGSEALAEVAVRVVNFDGDLAHALPVLLPEGLACDSVVMEQLQAPPGLDADVVNPPSDMARVSPTRVQGDDNWTFPPMSLTTVRWTGCGRSRWPRAARPATVLV